MQNQIITGRALGDGKAKNASFSKAGCYPLGISGGRRLLGAFVWGVVFALGIYN
jgi:hypothetical protein